MSVVTQAAAASHAVFCLLAVALLLPRARANGIESAGLAVAAFVLFGSMFFGSTLLLGVVQVLTGSPLVRFEAAALVSGTAVLVIGLRHYQRTGPIPPRMFRDGIAWWRDLDVPTRTLVVLSTGAALLLFGMLCLGYPRGFEPRSYHLPVAGHILQTHSLSAWDGEYMDTFPANASVFYAFVLALLPEHLAAASNLPYLLGFLVSLYALGRAIGADRSASMVVACGAATIPMVAFSSLETGADLGGIAFLGGAVYFALAGDHPRPFSTLLAGLAAGLSFGFKSTHLVSIGILVVAILVRAARTVAGQRRSFRLFAAAAPFLVGAVAMAGPWWLRNQIEFRNPLYPVHLGKMFDALGWSKAPDVDYFRRGSTQFEWVRSETEWFVYPWVEWHVDNENFKHSSGLGAFVAALAPAALLTGFAELARGPRGRRESVGLLLFGAAVVSAVWWIIGDRQPRYLMGMFVYILPLAALLIARSTGKPRRAITSVAVVATVLMIAIDFSGGVVSMAGIEKLPSRSEFYDYPPEVDGLPIGSTVLNLISRPENWGLFGAAHGNVVINSQRAFRLLGVEAKPGEPPPSAELAEGPLRALGATHVVVSSRTHLRLPEEVRLVEIGHTPERADRPAEALYRIEFQRKPSR